MGWHFRPKADMRITCRYCNAYADSATHMCEGRRAEVGRYEGSADAAAAVSEQRWAQMMELRTIIAEAHKKADAYKRLEKALEQLGYQPPGVDKSDN